MDDELPSRRNLPAELQSRSLADQGTRLPSRGGTALSAVVEQFKLRQLTFTDIYMSEMGRALICGAAESNGAEMIEIPDHFADDIERLHGIVCDKGQQESEFMVDFDTVRYRCSKIVSQQEIWYALRRMMTPIPRLGTLRLLPFAVQHLSWLGRRSGLIVIAGATGQGKTTTASMLLREYLHAFGGVAVTVEDPPELPLEGDYPGGYCFQLKVVNGNFGEQMRRAMRYMPRYILLGEVRDKEAASQALTAAINGHLVITTVHAGSAIESLQRLLKIASGVDDLELARGILSEGLAGVIYQKMLRIKDPTTGDTRVSIVPQFLFTGKEAKVRTKIRDGKFETLKDDIEQQLIRMKNKQSPVSISEAPPSGGRNG
jgi:Tfp pilus assembly pilus retraction ATPase PilT